MTVKCSKCKKAVKNSEDALFCEMCSQWVHSICAEVNKEEYDRLLKSEELLCAGLNKSDGVSMYLSKRYKFEEMPLISTLFPSLEIKFKANNTEMRVSGGETLLFKLPNMTSVVTHTISDVKIVSMEKSQYVIPLSLLFKQNGVTRRWDIVRAHPSVVIIIFNTTRKVLVLVKQFRPAVYYGSVPEEDKKETIDALKYPAELGVTIEFCAGILDKDKSLEETAKEEVLEETGYEVEASSLQKIKTFRSSVGILGEEQTVFYVEVTDSMKKTEGGGVHDENIEVIEMTLDESEKYLNQEKVISSGGFLFVLQWFMTHKKPLFQ
ncbi:unnamed protein product [Bemisia tabaci]|uniref:Uridine diphosphate glucose pyrophosphatase NUDT14 n=2 Tax=Bemisia tabaci TaxID=7038 RepID=A0A9P0FAH9_BEMTA|nr:unnamed protein product [Bemisia tabaci]